MSNETSRLENLQIERGQTQVGVNQRVLELLLKIFPRGQRIQALDLPCGKMEFLTYLQQLYPGSTLVGADIEQPTVPAGVEFVEMDLTREFTLPRTESFDLVTSISGVMMFSNTLSFIENCVARLKPGGTFIVTNDNSATIIDRLSYLFAARYRLFKPVYEDGELLTENVPVQELCRLLRKQGIEIEKIEYTSTYAKDILYLPAALLVYPLQRLYLSRSKSALPQKLVREMYPFKHLFGKHYIIVGKKK